MNRVGIILTLFLAFGLKSQEQLTDSISFYKYVIGKDALVDKVLLSKKYRTQIIYTDFRDSLNNKPITIDLSTNQYFYPASTVKLPIAILTMEKLNRLGLSLDDVLTIKDDYHCGNTRFITKTLSRKLTFRQMLTELIVVSDNDYYNGLYHFLTPEEINKSLKEKGYTDTHIYKSFTGCNPVEQMHCNSIEVFDQNGKSKYKQEECRLELASMAGEYEYDSEKLLGSKHEYKLEIVDGPYDFNYNLEMPLKDGHLMMLNLFSQDADERNNKWLITKEQQEFLIDIMTQFPKDLKNQKFQNRNKFPNNLYKYSIFGEHPYEAKFKTVSKIGLSYGFTTEYVTVIDEEGELLYTLSISLYTNANDIVNDGDYEYESIARPFCDRISRILISER